jgi:ParB/RepB/Spo0J family partition protein
MKAVGLIQPITVRALGLTKAWEIIAGHRRVKAAKHLGWDTIPANVVSATNVEVMEIALVENLERQSLTPLEEAEGFAQLREAGAYSPEQLAQRTGRTKGWVYQRLKLLDLCPEAKRALQSGALQLSVAVPLARLPTPKLQLKALERVAGEVPLSSREAIEYLQREFCVSLKTAVFDRKDDMLIDGAGPCTTCPKRSGSKVPGLFEDLEAVDICTDVVCFQAKAKATWEAKAESAAKKGAAVLGIAEGKKLFRDGSLIYGAGYVELDQPVHEDAQKRTWSQLLEKAPPPVVVAPDAELRVHRLYRQAEAEAAAATTGLKWAKAKVERSRSPAPAAATKEESPNDEGLRKVREQVAAEVLVGSEVKMLSLSTPPPALFVLMAKAVEATRPKSPAVDAYLAKQRVQDFAAWVPKASERELLGFVFVALAEEWCGGTWDGFDDGLETMAKAFGFDLSAMVRDAVAAQK